MTPTKTKDDLTAAEAKVLRKVTKKGRKAAEIADLLGYSNPRAVNRPISALVRYGLVKSDGRRPSTYTLV